MAVVTPGEHLLSRASQSRQGETHPESSTRLVVRSKKEKKGEVLVCNELALRTCLPECPFALFFLVLSSRPKLVK